MSANWKLFVNEMRNFTKNRKMLLAVSGGVDSMLLLKMMTFHDFDFEVGHFRHGMRKDDHIDHDIVKSFCLDHNIVFHSEVGEISTSNSEADARNQRWEFLETTAQKRHCEIIVTAHNLNDKVENFLYRIMRGTGADSLVMPSYAIINGIIRYKPMLEISKDAIIKYAKKHRVVYRHDVTNDDIDYDRNWIRHVIMPEMNKRRNIMKTIPKTMESIQNMKKGVPE